MLLKMWKIALIFVSVLCRSNAQIPTDGDCYLEEVETIHWTTSFQNTPVSDKEETEFKRFLAENIESFEVRGPDYGKYFSASLEEGYLLIAPTEAFKNYETDQESVADPVMYIQLAFLCSNNKDKTLAFYQPIIDNNNHLPEFRQSSYTYLLPMPLSANFDIAPFGATIEACDTDISNIRVDFSISPDEDFSVSWKAVISGTKNKCHTAVITTKTQLRLTASKSYEITVTDTGNPTESATAVLNIEIDEETTLPPNPQFEAAYYTATYNLEDEQHSMVVNGPIILQEGCSKLTLTLTGEHAGKFGVGCVEEQVVVTLSGQLPKDALENDPIVLITVEADLENAEELGRTVLVVYLPKQECPVEPTTTPSTPTECPICPTESTTSYTCPPCTTEPTPTECPPCITIPPVECTTLPPTECPPCSTTPGESPSTPTECPVTCPPCSTIPSDCPSAPTECPVSCPTPEFTTECPPCLTTCPTDSTTPGECPSTPTETPATCPPCSSTPGDCPSAPTECPVTCPTPEFTTECPPCLTTCPTDSTTPGECPSAPTECPVTCPTPEITTECPLSPTTPGECPSAATECSFTCPPCSTTLGEPSSPTECPVTCPTPEQTTECPPCSTTPAPEPSIKFEQDQYSYKIKSWYVGHVVGVVKAVASPKEGIEYSIEPVNDFLECNKETGELRVLRLADAGSSSFNVYAVGVDTGTRAQTIVLAEVIPDEEDTDPETESSILVKYVEEEEAIDIPLPCQYTYCRYSTPVQYPTTEDDIFSIEDNVLHVANIKREREEIINMPVPQFSLQLFLEDAGEPLQENTKRSNNSSQIPSKANLQTRAIPEEWVFIPAVVPNVHNQLLLSIIIKDINNNRPVFAIGEELIVGYPTAELAVQLTPPYLAKVVATDLDAGINAQIQYSTDSSHFIVHPETGVIYPGEDAFGDEANLIFTVTARDKNGAADGLSADLKIEVKPLRQENLIVLMVKNLMLEDIDDTMEKLSEQTNMKINYLTAAVIPLNNAPGSDTLRQLTGFLRSMMMPRATSDHSSRIIVYGLDTDNQPVETDNLQEVLEDAGVLEDFTIDKWVPEGTSNGGNDGDDDPSTAGFIAAIAVLSSLLAIFIIAAAVFYYFKIYRVRNEDPYNSMDEEDSNSVNFEKNPRTSTMSKHEESPQRRVTGFVFNPPPIEEDEDEFGERRYEDTPDYVKGEWPKTVEEETVANKVRFVDIAKDELHGESKVKFEDSSTDYDGDQRKSVTFRETVEKINIVVDDRPDEPDDIFDQRL